MHRDRPAAGLILSPSSAHASRSSPFTDSLSSKKKHHGRVRRLGARFAVFVLRHRTGCALHVSTLDACMFYAFRVVSSRSTVQYIAVLFHHSTTTAAHKVRHKVVHVSPQRIAISNIVLEHPSVVLILIFIHISLAVAVPPLLSRAARIATVPIIGRGGADTGSQLWNMRNHQRIFYSPFLLNCWRSCFCNV